ncbi:MAG TPA: hypothetical protein VFH02_03580 [Jiangellaceae bacterium]|nr:hypothetical protein [Jiangellaceae bacterium]
MTETAEVAALRFCPSCRQRRPAGEWRGGRNLVGGMVREVCRRCEPPEPEDVRITQPRFVVDFGAPTAHDRLVCEVAYHQLPERCGVRDHRGVDGFMADLSAALRTQPAAEIDISGLDARDRRIVCGILEVPLRNGPGLGSAGAGLLRRIFEAWRSSIATDWRG